MDSDKEVKIEIMTEVIQARTTKLRAKWSVDYLYPDVPQHIMNRLYSARLKRP